MRVGGSAIALDGSSRFATVSPDLRVTCQSQSAAAAAPAPVAASGPPPPPPTAAGPPPPSASFASSVPGWHGYQWDLESSSGSRLRGPASVGGDEEDGVVFGGRGGGDAEDAVDVLIESSGDEGLQGEGDVGPHLAEGYAPVGSAPVGFSRVPDQANPYDYCRCAGCNGRVWHYTSLLLPSNESGSMCPACRGPVQSCGDLHPDRRPPFRSLAPVETTGHGQERLAFELATGPGVETTGQRAFEEAQTRAIGSPVPPTPRSLSPAPRSPVPPTHADDITAVAPLMAPASGPLVETVPLAFCRQPPVGAAPFVVRRCSRPSAQPADVRHPEDGQGVVERQCLPERARRLASHVGC